MPIKRYDPKTKAAFLKAATDARAAGKSWPDVHAAAKTAGYPGTVKGIIRMLEKTGPKTKKPAATAKPAAVTPAPKVTAAKAPKKPKAAPKQAVGKRYSGAMKSAIMSAAIASRGAGKKWAEAHQAAKAVGYRGSLQGIVKMLRASNRTKQVKKPVAKRGPGRPKGTGKRGGRLPMKPISLNGVGSIQAAVEKMVQERVGAAIDRAIAALKAL